MIYKQNTSADTADTERRAQAVQHIEKFIRVGDVFNVNGQQFRVASVSPRAIVLRPPRKGPKT